MWRLLLLILRVLLLGCCAAHTRGAEPRPDNDVHQVGYRNISIDRPDSTTFSAWVFYPANRAERDAAMFDGADPFPALSFGHGFLQPPQRYKHLLRDIASHGYIVIATNSHRGIAPDHAQYSRDLAQCLEHLIELSRDESSWLAGSVDPDALALGGHSMGGGAAAHAAGLIRVQVLIPLAGAPLRSNDAATGIVDPPKAQLHIVGSEDRIVPPTASRTLIDEGGNRRVFATIEGGSHCGFMDETILGCDVGSLDHQTQLRITRSLMISFLDLYLKGDEAMHDPIWIEHEDEREGLVSFERIENSDQ